jgi:hypothetical protein
MTTDIDGYQPPPEGWPIEHALRLLVPIEFERWSEAMEARKREPTHFLKPSYLDPDRTVTGDKNPGWARAIAIEREALKTLLVTFRQALARAGLVAVGRRGGLNGPRERIPDEMWAAFERLNAADSVIGEVRSRSTHYRAVTILAAAGAHRDPLVPAASEPAAAPPRIRPPGSPDMYDWDRGVQLLVRDSYVNGWPRTRAAIRGRLLAVMAAEGLAVPRKRDTADNVLARDLPLLWEAAGRRVRTPTDGG